MHSYQYKILVVGDLGTGKTSVLQRFVYNTFSTHYKSTIGVDFALKVVQQDSDVVVHLQLWDIAGQERFGSMTRVYYKDAIGAFLVYDVTRPKTLDHVVKWKHDLDAKVQVPGGYGDIPAILLANKIDQQANPKSKQEMTEFCVDNGFIQWFEVSAKENIGVSEAGKYLIDAILQLESTIERKNEYDDGDSAITLHEPIKLNKSNPKCCS